MRLFLAFKAFFKALKDPKKAELLFIDKPQVSTPTDNSHLQLLGMLQQSGRLIDFLKEDITNYTDEQVGAAVRQIHADCSQALEELITVRPVLEENEGQTVRVPAGYDSAAIKLVGKVKGTPPFQGVLLHKGWKAHKKSLPKRVGEMNPDVLFPAEVEVK